MTKPPIKLLDEAGNYLQVEIGNSPEIRKVSLYLIKERKKRQLGTINTEERVMYMDRKRGRHLHRSSQSYGFNYKLISEAKTFHKIMLTDEHGTYLIPNAIILNMGKFLYFKQKGFEKQIFLSLNVLENHRVGSLL